MIQWGLIYKERDIRNFSFLISPIRNSTKKLISHSEIRFFELFFKYVVGALCVEYAGLSLVNGHSFWVCKRVVQNGIGKDRDII